MKLYLDTEFNGHGGELISMAIVSAYGHSWYYACKPMFQIDPWVQEHVIPVLDTEYLNPAIFRLDFQRWIKDFSDPEIVCDWHADAKHFCDLMLGHDYEHSLDMPFTITVLKTPPGQPISKRPHNALADAIALREWHNAADPVKAA